MTLEIDLLHRKIERERNARFQAEKLLEQKSLELYESNQNLLRLNERLEKMVESRTQKLSHAEQEYFALVESITDIICKVNLKGEIVFVNQIASVILKRNKSELIGKNVLELIPKEYRKRIFFYFSKQFARRNRIFYSQVPFTTSEGTILWASVNVQFTEERCMGCDLKSCFHIGSITDEAPMFTCDFREIIIVAHHIQNKENKEEEVAKIEHFQDILLNVLKLSVQSRPFDEKIAKILRMVGTSLKLNCLYMLKNDVDQYVESNKWHKDSANGDRVEDLPYEHVPSIRRLQDEDSTLFVDKFENLPEDIQRKFEIREVLALAMLPVKVGEIKWGVLVFEEHEYNRSWTTDKRKMLESVAHTISLMSGI